MSIKYVGNIDRSSGKNPEHTGELCSELKVMCRSLFVPVKPETSSAHTFPTLPSLLADHPKNMLDVSGTSISGNDG